MFKIEDYYIETHKDSIILNLGCGRDIDKSCINCDRVDGYGKEYGDGHIYWKHPDILLDLDRPLPFKDNSIDEIYLERVMGHVKHPIKLRKELHRILKYNGYLFCEACTCEDVNPRFNTDHTYIKILGTEQEILDFINQHRGK